MDDDARLPALRASDQDRDGTLDRLAAAAGDGRLTLDEYSHRADQALQARMQHELASLTSDLQALPSAAPAVEDVQVRAVLGNEVRRGRWRLPARLGVRSLLASCEIDLQEAALSAHTTRIDARAVLGSVTICVPDGLDVRLSGSTILGNKSSELRAMPAHGAPVVEIHARVLLGSITVCSPDAASR